MITLSYELLGLMMIAPIILGAVMSYIIYSCDGESKNKTTLDRLNTRLEIEKEANKILNRDIEAKDEQLRSLGEMIEHRKHKGTNTRNIQYRKIEALRNRFKAIKKGEVYSGKEVIEDGIKMYSIKVNGATYIMKRSNFKIIK